MAKISVPFEVKMYAPDGFGISNPANEDLAVWLFNSIPSIRERKCDWSVQNIGDGVTVRYGHGEHVNLKPCYASPENVDRLQKMMQGLLRLRRLNMYATAYSPLYEAFVKIVGVHLGGLGEPIVTGEVVYEGETKNHLFREHELERYCL